MRRLSEQEKNERKLGITQKENRYFNSKADFRISMLYFSRSSNQKKNILYSVERQMIAYEEKYGRTPSQEYLSDKASFFTNKPYLQGSEIAIQLEPEIIIKLAQSEIYPRTGEIKETIWSVSPRQSTYILNYVDAESGKITQHKFEILNRRSTVSGLEAMTIRSEETNETIILAQGSTPAINEPHKNIVGWSQDWIVNNFRGNTSVSPVDIVANVPRYIKGLVTGEKQVYREPYTPIQYREVARYALDMQKKYGEVDLILGHSLQGAGAFYGGDRTGISSIAIDPAPNNMKMNKPYTHLALIPGDALLNRTKIQNDVLVHYTAFRHYGKGIPTPSIEFNNKRYGFGVGATGVPAYRSSTNYTEDPIIHMKYDDNFNIIYNPPSAEDIKKLKGDDHKMHEYFNSDITRQEIEDISNMLVRP